jgi:hypothetical protein
MQGKFPIPEKNLIEVFGKSVAEKPIVNKKKEALTGGNTFDGGFDPKG